MWDCQCDCGQTCLAHGARLRCGQKKSCGCWKTDTTLEKPRNRNWGGYGEISGEFFTAVKSSAKIRNLEFNITIEQIWDLFLKQDRKCALSGVELKFILTARNRNLPRNGKLKTASLDRIDSSKGYTLDNVQWIHKHVNHIKMSLSDEDFINWCRKIVAHNKDRFPISEKDLVFK